MPLHLPDQDEDIMWPEPTTEQTRLWDEIENSLTEEGIEIYAKLQELPDEFKKHFTSSETASEIQAIMKKNQLSEDITKTISYVAAMVLLGEINIVDFVKTLQQKCNLQEEPARQLARDINRTIFLPVKENLKQIHRVPEWPREEETNQRAAPGGRAEEPKGPKLDGNVVDLKGKWLTNQGTPLN